MLEAPVLRAPLFQAVINNICKGEFDEALNRLTILREQYSSDPHSGVEIDRWIARMLERLDKKEEAYRLLQGLGPVLEQFQYDLSSHYLQVVTLQELLGRLDELQNYCRSISGHFRTSDALGHLDWILRYARSSDDAQLTVFMHTALMVCAIQLGLDPPPRQIVGRDLRIVLERCIEARDSANQRYELFWNELQQLTSNDLATDKANDLVMLFLQSEPCPLFRDMARSAMR